MNTLDFSNQNVYVGFDVHRKDWKVSIMMGDIHHRTFSQDPSPEALANYLKTNFPSATFYSAYEAGFSGFWIHRRLQSLGVHSIIVNPADIPTTGKEAVQKEDRRDSLKIVKSLRAGLLNSIYIPSPESVDNRGLLRMRATLVKDITRTKNRVKSFLNFSGISIPKELEKQSKSWTKSYLQWLNELQMSASAKMTLSVLIEQGTQFNDKKRKVTRELKLLAETAPYKKNFELLRSIPGIGTISAITHLFELDQVNRFANLDKFCSFMGLVPSTRSSGEKDRVGNITPRRNALLRESLIESAWVAIRRDPALMNSFIALRSRMNDKRAIVRIAKRLAGRIYMVLKTQQPYQMGRVK